MALGISLFTRETKSNTYIDHGENSIQKKWPPGYIHNLRKILNAVTIIFITSTIVWPQVNSRKGTQPHPLTENWIEDLLSMSLPIRIRPSFPFRQSLLPGSFHKSPILIHQRNENHNHRKIIKLITWTTVFSNSVKLGAMPCRTQERRVGGKFWQNVVDWRRDWQTTSVFLPGEPHEQYEKAKS